MRTVAVRPDDVRKLAALCRTETLFGKVGAFADVLVFAVQAFLAVTKHSKVAADTLAAPDAHMGERTVHARAPASIGEVHAERCAFRRRVVRERAVGRAVRTGTLQKRPADRYLVGVVLIGTCEATVAGT